MTTKVLMVCDAMPLAGRSGHQSYMREIADYALDRGFALSVMVLSDRMEFVAFNHKTLNLPTAVDVLGPHLARLGPVFVYKAANSWLRPPYVFVRAKRRRLRQLISGNRDEPGRTIAYIGDFISEKATCFVERQIAAIRPDVIMIDTIFRARPVIGEARTGKAILIAHDIFHQKCESLSRVFSKVVANITRDTERDIAGNFDHIIAISERDKAEFEKLVPGSVTTALTPSIRYKGHAHAAPFPRAVFVGSGANHNVDGLTWFLSDIWPLVRQSVPDAQIDVIGSVCRHVAEGPGINRLGVLDNMDPILLAARCAINPLRAGSGLKVKMMDYLACGVPVVTTDVGAQGFVADGSEPFTICEAPADFATATVQFLPYPLLRIKLSARCEAYAQHFSRQENYQKLDRIFADILPSLARGSKFV